MGLRTERTYCRICAATCGMVLQVDEAGQIAHIAADHDHHQSLGFACLKGLVAAEAYHGPGRILRPLKRLADGTYAEIPLDAALAQIAARLETILDRHAPDAVAGYRGTMSYLNTTAFQMLGDWLKAFGSKSLYSTMTIDQSAKWVAEERLGTWPAGLQSFDSSEAMLIFGSNPLVSMTTRVFPNHNPQKRLRAARQRGFRLIVVDPRVSETARQADLHLRPLPGEDAAIAAGLLHLILREGWEDKAFCERWVDGLDDLRSALALFTPDYVAQRAGIAAGDLEQAARLFAHDSRRGCAVSGTGPDMGPHSNLAEQLIQTINVVCGRFARAGEPVNPCVLSHRTAPIAAAALPRRGFEHTARTTARDAVLLYGERLTANLVDDILTPGPDQVRALFVLGGNPLGAIPDSVRTERGLAALDLLVAVEPYWSETARIADYILPPRLGYERSDMPHPLFELRRAGEPFLQYTPRILPDPPGSDLCDDWFALWDIARRLGKPVTFDGVVLDAEPAPDNDALLAILARKARVPFAELARHPGGKVYPAPALHIAPAEAAQTGRFTVMAPDVADELADCLASANYAHGFTHRLAARRMRDVQNTMYRHIDTIRRRVPGNPAWLSPGDMASLGLADGDLVQVRSAKGAVIARARADASQRDGVVAITHGFGGRHGEDDIDRSGVRINELISMEEDIEPINLMPRMTGVPVTIARCIDQTSSHGSHP